VRNVIFVVVIYSGLLLAVLRRLTRTKSPKKKITGRGGDFD
jgi:hypothetical protein